MTPWWVTLLAAVIPTVLSCIVTLFISRKSQINKNSDSIKSLSKNVSKLKVSLESWQRLASDVNDLNYQISRLEQENEELREKNKELNKTMQRYNRNQRSI